MRLGLKSNCVKNVIIWGNHSSTQYPDVRHAVAIIDGKEVSVPGAISDDAWIKGDFIKVCSLFLLPVTFQVDSFEVILCIVN